MNLFGRTSQAVVAVDVNVGEMGEHVLNQGEGKKTKGQAKKRERSNSSYLCLCGKVEPNELLTLSTITGTSMLPWKRRCLQPGVNPKRSIR